MRVERDAAWMRNETVLSAPPVYLDTEISMAWLGANFLLRRSHRVAAQAGEGSAAKDAKRGL